MKKNVIAVIGADYKAATLRKVEMKYGVSIIHHDGRSLRNNEMELIAQKANCLVLITSFCCHNALKATKRASKTIPVVYPKQTNLDIVVQAGLKELELKAV